MPQMWGALAFRSPARVHGGHKSARRYCGLLSLAGSFHDAGFIVARIRILSRPKFYISPTESIFIVEKTPKNKSWKPTRKCLTTISASFRRRPKACESLSEVHHYYNRFIQRAGVQRRPLGSPDQGLQYLLGHEERGRSSNSRHRQAYLRLPSLPEPLVDAGGFRGDASCLARSQSSPTQRWSLGAPPWSPGRTPRTSKQS